MKNMTEKQFFILQRFIELSELPTNSQTVLTQKKIILLKNIYNEQKCLMKIQPKQIIESKQRNVLHQASFYQKFQGHLGVPLMIWSGQDFDCLVLILEELGLSIYDRMRTFCQKNVMRIKDVCMIGIQLISIIKNFHERDYLHRNITPQTFCFGMGQKITKLYCTDLIYMKKFRAKNSLNHIQSKQNTKIEFLTPFLSNNVLKGKEASRRDDIISIVYMLIYLLKGKLPWQQDWEEEVSQKKQQVKEINEKQGVNFVFSIFSKKNLEIALKVERMKKIQESISHEELCQGVPREIREILDFAYELQFNEEPEYIRYIALLKKITFRSQQKNDSLFEWMETKQTIQSHLLANYKVLKLQTQKQKQMLSLVFEPYAERVNLDEQYDENIKKSVKPTIYSIAKANCTQKPNPSDKKKKKEEAFQHKKAKNCQII